MSGRSLPLLASLSVVVLVSCRDPSGSTGFGVEPEGSTGAAGGTTSGSSTGAEATGLPTTGEPATGGSTGGPGGTTGDPGSTTMSVPPCQIDQDCQDSPDGPLCVDGKCTTPCEPGATEECYSGPEGTAGVGSCAAGTRACAADGLGWGPCEGEVVPGIEACGNAVDDDCDGEADEDTDADGDGWGVCSGDCCDADGGTCFDAALVNPGAYEFVGNEVDDDCDGMMDEAPVSCDGNLASDSNTALDYARALDLCDVTVENPINMEDRRWGVISAKLTQADGTSSAAPVSRAIRPGFGSVIKPQKASKLVVLSSGHAADENDQAPPFKAFEAGVNTGKTSPPPQDWWTKNGGKFPNPPGCNVPEVPSANDSVMLTLRVRVPTNARSFSAKMYFFSAEYPEYVCSQYNDFFVALVDSLAPDNPADKNVAVYDDGNTKWPIGVNLVKVAQGLFTQCQGGTVGCEADGVPPSQYNGCKATTELQGTGFQLNDQWTCSQGQTMAGGGTGWLTLRGNVSPGETMELRLAIWDTGGHIFDSLVLLDAFEWSLEPAAPGVTPG
jgi:hypothetical protein